ncbi:class I SAM-dependent methyltransferase [Streptomyces sp. NPDC059985]|uniref:class I SAM-dependent methyltransferase n=1 Tax=Streptomyces sp. NPDC059985 TaxID=3347025 RepID=UPI0036C3F98F
MGAIAPSSNRLASALTEPVRHFAGRPVTVLEVGAGTGPVTRALLPILGDGSHLDVVELNPRLAAHLTAILREIPLPHQPESMRVHHCSIIEFETTQHYDVVISGLPFANFTSIEVSEIMEKCMLLLRPGGIFTYFAYRGTRKLRTVFASPSSAARHRTVEGVLEGYRRDHGIDSRTVWGNLPPARVHTLQANSKPLSQQL